MALTSALSVVVARAPGGGDGTACVDALLAACRGLSLELLVPAGLELRAPEGVRVQRFDDPPSALVPEQWGRGAERATGEFVGFLTTELSVRPPWAQTLLSLLEGGGVGAAGCVGIAPGAGDLARALQLSRFSAFLPAPGQPPEVVHDIPGDGAIYRRAAIAAHEDLLREGFFEVEFHRRFERDGQRLWLSREPLVDFSPGAGLAQLVRLRFRHGAGHGDSRVARHQESRARIAALAPAVPLVLVGRIARRAGPQRLGEVLRALGPLSVLTTAWAAGEAWGALTARSGGGES